MRYTKPTVITTQRAHVAIQTGANGEAKMHPLNIDHRDRVTLNSTSGAYEADE